jgi:hypothetical protein
MITKRNIREILDKYSEEITYEKEYSSRYFRSNTVSLGNAIKASSYDGLVNELYEEVFEELMKNVRLEAELKIYQTVIGNSNFKMATAKIKEEK